MVNPLATIMDSFPTRLLTTIPQFLRRRLALVALVSCLPTIAAAGNYTYQVLYQTNSNLTITAATSPSLNDAGYVAFLAVDGIDGITQKIVSGNGGPLTTIATRTVPFPFHELSQSPAINNAGDVEFAAVTAGVQEILRGNGIGAPTKINGSLTGNFTYDLGVPAINDSSQVAFNAYNNLDPSIYVGSGGAPAFVYDTANSSVDINNAGTIVWDYASAIRRWSGGIASVVESTSGPFSGFSASPAVNSPGHVVFSGDLDGGGTAVAVNDGISTHIVASSLAGFTFINSEPGINDQGKIVFRGSIPGLNSAVFGGPDPINDLAIYRGMPLAGGIVDSYGFFRHGFNNQGQIAFSYSLQQGGSGIALATPLPEPGTGLLLVGTLLLLGGCAWRPVRCRERSSCST